MKGHGRMMMIGNGFEDRLIRHAAASLQRQLGSAALSYCDRALVDRASQPDAGLLMALRAALLEGAPERMALESARRH